jgi:hypothetical protein
MPGVPLNRRDCATALARTCSLLSYGTLKIVMSLVAGQVGGYTMAEGGKCRE